MLYEYTFMLLHVALGNQKPILAFFVCFYIISYLFLRSLNYYLFNVHLILPNYLVLAFL